MAQSTYFALFAVLMLVSVSPVEGQLAFNDGLVPIVRVAQAPGGATFNGTIQPNTAGGFDPYSTTTLQPPSLLPQSGGQFAPPSQYGAQPYAAPYPNSTFTTGPQASSPNGSYLFAQPNGQIAYLPRLMQHARARYTWINGNGSNDVEFNIFEAEATFLFPFFRSPTPILLSPGGAINFTAGPGATSPADVPNQLYDLYLDGAWRPQVTQWLAADLGLRTGVYTDFNAFDSKAIRYQGRALAVFNFSPTVEVRVGAVYLDRVDIQWLPSGGLVWTPDENRRFEFLFPNPKFAWRLSQYGNADVWFFIAGEYGGDSWYVERDSGLNERMDYNDIRVSLGMEWSTPRGLKGMVEVGYLWERELIYKTTTADNVSLDSTFMLRAGVQF